MTILTKLRTDVGEILAWLSEQPHRRALSTVLTFALCHFSTKFAGLDSDTVDALLGLTLVPLAAAWQSKPS